MILVSILFAGNLQANEYGVPSANPADNPPVIDPDVESRSTDPDRPPAYGPEDAFVLIVIFSDYKCPACRGSWRGFRRTVETELEASRKLAEGGLSPAEVREHRAIANHTDSATFELYRTSILLPEASVASDTGAQ